MDSMFVMQVCFCFGLSRWSGLYGIGNGNWEGEVGRVFYLGVLTPHAGIEDGICANTVEVTKKQREMKVDRCIMIVNECCVGRVLGPLKVGNVSLRSRAIERERGQRG